MYQLKEQKDWHLCAIDERSVACVAEQPGLDGYSKIYTLNTGPEKFNLSSTLRVKAGRGITDICFVKTTDGTPCLLLSFPWNFLVQLVEMVGGKVRWQVDKQQMGGSSGMRTSFPSLEHLHRWRHSLRSYCSSDQITSAVNRGYGLVSHVRQSSSVWHHLSKLCTSARRTSVCWTYERKPGHVLCQQVSLNQL